MESFTSDILNFSIPTLKDEIYEIKKACEGPCTVLTDYTSLLFLHSSYLYKYYIATCMRHESMKEYVRSDREIVKLIALVHGLRSLDLFLYSVESFFGMLEEYNKDAAFDAKTLGYQTYKQQKQTFLQKSETLDRIFTAACKGDYARRLSCDVVQRVETFCHKILQDFRFPAADTVYLRQIFERVYGAFEVNMEFNQHVHRLRYEEVVLAIIFKLDREERECVTKIGERMLQDYGDAQGQMFDDITTIGSRLFETEPK